MVDDMFGFFFIVIGVYLMLGTAIIYWIFHENPDMEKLTLGTYLRRVAGWPVSIWVLKNFPCSINEYILKRDVKNN